MDKDLQRHLTEEGIQHTKRCSLGLYSDTVTLEDSLTVSYKVDTPWPCCCSASQSCPTLCDPVDCSTPGFPVLHSLPEFAQTYVHWVGDATQPSRPLSSPPPLPSIFPSIRVFSKESSLRIRLAKILEFSFHVRPSIEYSGLVSFRTDWFEILTY